MSGLRQVFEDREESGWSSQSSWCSLLMLTAPLLCAGPALGPGHPAGNEIHADLPLTDEETEAQRGHTARKGQPGGHACSCAGLCPLQGPGPSQGDARGWVEKPSERDAVQAQGRVRLRAAGPGWSEQGHLWGRPLPEFSKPSPTPDQPQGPGPAGSYKAWVGRGDPETEES